MISIPVFILVLGVLIFVHEAGHFLMAKWMGVRVEKFSLGFGRHILRKRVGQTEYCISMIPLGGYVKMAGELKEELKGKADEFLSQSPGRRFWIVFSGPLVNYLMGFIIFSIVFFAGYPALTSKVGGLKEGFGAQRVGIQVGDFITAIDGISVSTFEDLQMAVFSRKGQDKVSVRLLRNGQEMGLEVPLTQEQTTDIFKKKVTIGFLGISPADDIVIKRHGLMGSLALGMSKTFDITYLTYKSLGMILTGQMSVRELGGPLSIYDQTSKALKMGIVYLLGFFAFVSVSLAIFNLLPLPVLDGGHIFFLLLEKIRGKSLSLKAEEVISRVGFTTLIALVVLVSYNDIMRFFGDKISRLFR